MCNLHIYMIPSFPFSVLRAAPQSPSACRAAAGLGAITLAGAWAMAPTDALWLVFVAPVLEETVFRTGLQEELLRNARFRVAGSEFPAGLVATGLIASLMKFSRRVRQRRPMPLDSATQ